MVSFYFIQPRHNDATRPKGYIDPAKKIVGVKLSSFHTINSFQRTSQISLHFRTLNTSHLILTTVSKMPTKNADTHHLHKYVYFPLNPESL